MGKRPSKNEILRRNLSLWVCKTSQAVCVYGIGCRYSIPFFRDDDDPKQYDFCKVQITLICVKPKLCLMLPLFEE